MHVRTRRWVREAVADPDVIDLNASDLARAVHSAPEKACQPGHAMVNLRVTDVLWSGYVGVASPFGWSQA